MNETTPSDSLAGQVALVTGSTQGIGAGIARTLARHGASVAIHGLDVEGGKKVAQSLGVPADKTCVLGGDLRDEGQCRSLVRQTLERFGHLDILVNNAGVFYRGTVENTSVELWDTIFAINLRAPFILCQEAVRPMKERQAGCIINIGSVNASFGLPRLLAYSASKGGLATFTRNLSNALTTYRIRVNQINPGWVLTEGERHMQSVLEGRGERWLEEAQKTRPFGRLLAPEDIASAALFFATNELITGAILDYDQVPVGAPREI